MEQLRSGANSGKQEQLFFQMRVIGYILRKLERTVQKRPLIKVSES